jgi:1-acyl-sn-glycerol-3-phosphate acyltransferase
MDRLFTSASRLDVDRILAVPTSMLLWAAGGLHFVLSFGLIASALSLAEGRRVFPLVRRLMRAQLRVMGVRLRVTGVEHFDPSRAYLILGNHQSLFDLIALPAALPAHAVGVEADYHFRIPLWGHLIRRWGNISIDRASRREAIASLEAARRGLAAGTSIVILPEGHRTRTGAIGPFKSGPFHLALAAGSDILPFVIDGLFDFNPKGDWRLRPGRVRLAFGRPIAYDTFRRDSVEALKNRLRKAMMAIKEEK